MEVRDQLLATVIYCIPLGKSPGLKYPKRILENSDPSRWDLYIVSELGEQLLGATASYFRTQSSRIILLGTLLSVIWLKTVEGCESY